MFDKFDPKGVTRIYFYWDKEKDQILIQVDSLNDKAEIFTGTLKDLMEYLALNKLFAGGRKNRENIMHDPFSRN